MSFKPVIKENCHECGYIDKSLGRGKCFKCHTKSCPDYFWGEEEKKAFLASKKKNKS